MQTGELLPFVHAQERPTRAANVVTALLDAGHEVVLWSADFIHQHRKHLTGRASTLHPHPQLTIRLIASPGYQGSVTPRRLLDHAVLARHLGQALQRVDPPDVAFVGFPPIEFAHVAALWLQDRRVPFVLDVKDQWPAALLRPLPDSLKPVGRLGLLPYRRMQRRTFRLASALSSMSEPFLDWTLAEAGRSRNESDFVLPLAAAVNAPSPTQILEAEQWLDQKGIRRDGSFRVCFIGSLGGAVDLTPLHHALTIHNVQYVIAGDGPTRSKWVREFERHPNVVFPGWLDLPQATALARRSNVALAPYIDEQGFQLSVPNKVVDALAWGVPVMTNLKGLTRDLIESYEIGYLYDVDPVKSLNHSLVEALSEADPLAMSERCRTTHLEMFDPTTRYCDLVQRLADLAQESSA